MKIKCPNCSKFVAELLVCDSCKAVGCVRCIGRFNQKWICYDCKARKPEEKENELFSIFK